MIKGFLGRDAYNTAMEHPAHGRVRSARAFGHCAAQSSENPHQMQVQSRVSRHAGRRRGRHRCVALPGLYSRLQCLVRNVSPLPQALRRRVRRRPHAAGAHHPGDKLQLGRGRGCRAALGKVRSGVAPACDVALHTSTAHSYRDRGRELAMLRSAGLLWRGGAIPLAKRHGIAAVSQFRRRHDLRQRAGI